MVETIVPALCRRIPRINYRTEIFKLPDSDLVPLNWIDQDQEKLAVVVPGLESNSTRSYIKNISYYLSKAGFDVLVIDHRGCKIPNQLFRSYHSGNSEDLKAILESDSVQKYRQLFLIGFSLGGNIMLKYLGENKGKSNIQKAATVCAPYDLIRCSEELQFKKNRLFRNRFVKSLKKSLLLKQKSFPEMISPSAINACKSLWDIDDLYTAPAHGFKDARDYYSQCSSKYFLKDIAIPTLLINAKNDPLVPLDEETINFFYGNNNLRLLITEKGGHLGFPNRWLNGINFYEKAVVGFFC
jgi:uncharacterized protein